MSVYDSHLPTAFPHVIELAKEDIKLYIEMLIEGNDDYVAGSSFAITSDVHNSNDNRRLWLSYHSALRLWKRGIITLPDEWKKVENARTFT